MKTRPVGAELFHADRQTDGPTDRKELVVAFRNFSNGPKNSCFIFTTGNSSPLTRITLLSVQEMREGE